MTIKNYKKLLEEHDWYYQMSDDHQRYLDGLKTDTELKKFASINPRLLILYKEKESTLTNQMI